MKRISSSWKVAAVVFVAALGAAPGAARAELVFGLLPHMSASELIAQYTPLAEYLTAQTGEKVNLLVPKDYDTFKALVKDGKIDFAFSNPAVFLQLKQGTGVTPLALVAAPKVGTRFRGILIARKGSGIETVKDVRGKKVVFVDQSAAGGRIFQIHLMSRSGLDVKKDFVTLPFAKRHDNVIMAVANGVADVGATREDDLEKMVGKVDVSKLKVIGFSDYFPNYVVFSAPRLDGGKAERIKGALLRLKPNDAEASRVMSPAKFSGFVPTVEKDFAQLLEAMKLAEAL